VNGQGGQLPTWRHPRPPCCAPAGSEPGAAQLLRALAYAAAGAAAARLEAALAAFEQKFRRGDYPPQRNLDKS
jgi:hypothetical protein